VAELHQKSESESGTSQILGAG